MNKIRILGLFTIIIGLLISTYFDSSDFQFFFGILIGLGIGWLISGHFFVIGKKEKETLNK